MPMMMPPPGFATAELPRNVDLLPLVSACVTLAIESSRLVVDIFDSGQLQVVDKASTAPYRETLSKEDESKAENPQTLADRASGTHINTGLLSRFSSALKIVGEEDDDLSTQCMYLPKVDDVPSCLRGVTMPSQYQGMSFDNLQVWIDPLDGTKEYTSEDKKDAKDAATVMIGICLNGKPVAGVITRAFTGETLVGIVGVGVFYQNFTSDRASELKQIASSRDKTRRVVCTTKSHACEALEQYVQRVNPSDVVRHGGCGGKVFVMLEGRADAYVFPKAGTKKWDTAAAEAIIVAGGGCITQPNGRPIEYSPSDVQNTTGLIATLFGETYHATFCEA